MYCPITHLKINSVTEQRWLQMLICFLPHPQTLFFCITSPFQPFLFLSMWSARSFHQPPTLCLFIHAFFVPAPLSLSLSLSLSLPSFLFITSGVQLAGSVDATTKNDVINYLGRDYVIKLLWACARPCVCVCMWMPLLSVYTCTCGRVSYLVATLLDSDESGGPACTSGLIC